MMKIVYKVVVVSLITLGVSILVGAFIYKPAKLLPWSYVSDQMHMKLEYYKAHQTKYNTLFIGSSVVRRGFNPEIFDALVDSSIDVHSYNFGINWMGSPENIFLVDNLALNNNDNLKYVFIELSKLKVIDYSNMHTARAIYWYNWKNYSFAIKAVMGSSSALHIKGSAVLSHTICYAENLLNIGYISEVNNFEKRDAMVQDSVKKSGDNFNGFAGLEGTVKADTEINAEENVQAGLIKFLNDTSGLTRRKIASANAFDAIEKNPELIRNYNKPYLEWIDEVIATLMAENIYPIFVISPKADKRQYDELLPVFFNINPKHRINIADSRKYPELYSVAFAGDETHLNKKGAARYSQILAHDFSMIIGEFRGKK